MVRGSYIVGMQETEVTRLQSPLQFGLRYIQYSAVSPGLNSFFLLSQHVDYIIVSRFI